MGRVLAPCLADSELALEQTVRKERRKEHAHNRHLLLWVPSCYFAMGTVLTMVVTATSILFANLGFSNAQAITYSSLVGLVYAFKPFWSPVLELFQNQKFFVLLMQFVLGVLFLGLALALNLSNVLGLALVLLLLAAIAGATMDMACDGLYVTTLDRASQAAYAGLQGMFWNIGPILASGLLVGLVGLLAGENAGYGKPSVHAYSAAWRAILIGLGILMLGLAGWHTYALPKEGRVQDSPSSFREGGLAFRTVIASFFQKRHVGRLLTVAFCFRLGVGMLDKVMPLFLLDARTRGGLGLQNRELGLLYGVLGSSAFICGSLLGGLLIARRGLRSTLLPLCLLMNLVNTGVVYLGYVRPESFWHVAAVFIMVKLGWGLGTVAHMIYMMQEIAPGPYRTAHYAFATGLGMALGITLAAMASAPLQAWLGYQAFFLLMIPAAVISITLAASATFREPEQQLRDCGATSNG